LLDGLGVNTSIETISRSPRLLDAISSNALGKSVQNTSGMTLGANIAGILTAVIVAVVITVVVNTVLVLLTGFIFIPGVLPILGLLAAGSVVGLKASDAMKGKVREMLLAKVDRQLRTAFGSQEAGDEIRSKSVELANALVKGHIDYLNAQIKLQEESFDERIKKNKESFRLSQADRIQLAERLQKIRTESIEPMRKRIQTYLDNVESVFSQNDESVAANGKTKRDADATHALELAQ